MSKVITQQSSLCIEDSLIRRAIAARLKFVSVVRDGSVLGRP